MSLNLPRSLSRGASGGGFKGAVMDTTVADRGGPRGDLGRETSLAKFAAAAIAAFRSEPFRDLRGGGEVAACESLSSCVCAVLGGRPDRLSEPEGEQEAEAE
jgi:hypothetical protein